MGCRLTQNIKHHCQYNSGGIRDIFLLDIKDFISCRYLGDGLYNTCYVEDIVRRMEDSAQQPIDYIRLDVVGESYFNETMEAGLHKQELQTFVRAMRGINTSQLLLASRNKYLVAYRTFDGKAFCFALDGGASVGFTQQSGQVGEAAGYQITISKLSNYPLFELDPDVLKYHLLSSEDLELMLTEDKQYVEIYKKR